MAIENVNRDDSKVLVLMGGRTYFSNGINLNTIQDSLIFTMGRHHFPPPDLGIFVC